MAIAVTIGHFGGEYLDARFHTKPVFSYALLIAGVAAAFLALYRIARAGLKDEKSDGDAPR